MTSLLLLLLAPLFSGSIKGLKAALQNRRGPGLLYDYRNLWKLWRKDYVWPRPATPVFLLGPVAAVLGPASAAVVLPVLPGVSFAGDFLVLVYLLNLGRTFQALAALDTGGAFGAQGSYRELLLAALTEPGTLLALAAAQLASGELSLAGLAHLDASNALVYLLVLVALAIALVAEGARMPVDDPTTHLELTMIHEAQLLDHSGPLLALYELAASLKLLVYVSLIGLLLPFPRVLAFALALVVTGVALAVLETYGVRLRYLRVPDLLSYNTLAGILATLGVVLRLRN